MDELKSEVEKLNKARAFNFYFYLVLGIYYFGVVFYGFTLAERLAGKIFLAYMAINIFISVLIVFILLRKKVSITGPDLKEDLAQAMYGNDFAPLTFIIPIFLSTIILIILDYIHDNKLEPWLGISLGLFWFLGVYRIVLTRKIIRKLYKKVFGHEYLSLFHF
ncbi:MAG: hypothetical protein E2O68_01655 [Deltaproteobacteria bacterium]|nr:MAG: hypothetical protein E2O68_01655 [Deltaproteobacteria bacterium]